MENQPEIVCHSCKSVNPVNAYFCLNCGKKLRDKPPSTTIWRQIVIYFVSLFLPPFGLWYVWKYFKAGDRKAKIIGIVAIILTIISIIFTVWLTEGFISSVSQSINEINNLNNI